MIRANKLSGGTAITCLGVGYNTGTVTTSCCVTNPQNTTETVEGNSASTGTNLSLPNGFGTITNMGINAQNKPYISIMPSKTCKLYYASLSASTIPPEEVSLTSGQEYNLVFSNGVSFIIY